MADTDNLSTAPIEPVAVTIIGTGDGSVPITSGTVATTPGKQQANLAITVVSPLMALSVRFVHTYLGSVITLLTAGMTSSAIPAADFWHLVLRCASLAFAGAAILSMKDILTVLSGLEKKWPLMTGNV